MLGSKPAPKILFFCQPKKMLFLSKQDLFIRVISSKIISMKAEKIEVVKKWPELMSILNI